MTQSLLTGAIRTKFSVTGATMRRRHAETKQSPNTNFAAVCPAIHLRVRATAAKAEFGILPFSEVSVGPPVAGVNPDRDDQHYGDHHTKPLTDRDAAAVEASNVARWSSERTWAVHVFLKGPAFLGATGHARTLLVVQLTRMRD